MRANAFLCVLLMLLLSVSMTVGTAADLNGDKTSDFNASNQSASTSPNKESCVHKYSNLQFTVTNFGMLGSEDGRFRDCETGESAPSAEFPAGSQVEYLYQGALWIGAIVDDDTLVSVGADGWNFLHELYPCDLNIGSNCTLERLSNRPGDTYYSPDAVADLEYIALYTDTLSDRSYTGFDYNDLRSHKPIDLEVTQHSYTWSQPGREDFAIIEYTLRSLSTAVDSAYLGIYLDHDIGHITHHSDMFIDDVSGHRTLSTSLPNYSSVHYSWAADNDGDPNFEQYDFSSCTGILGSALMALNMDGLYSFNWWQGNGNSTFDWGPWLQENSYFEFPHPGYGTPDGDKAKYFMMSAGEIDYDQFYSAVDYSDDGWLPPGTVANTIARGGDTRNLQSYGPIDIPADGKVTLALIISGGEDFHHDPAAYEALFDPEDPDPYVDQLDFTDLETNLTTALSILDETLKPTLDIVSPIGYESWRVGEERTISWNLSTGWVSGVDLEISYDGGDSWQLVESFGYAKECYDWVVNGSESKECRIRITAHSPAGDVVGESPDVFEIWETDDLVVEAQASRIFIKTGETVEFNAYGCSSEHDLALTYRWTTDDHPDPSVGQTASFTFPTTGRKNVTLRVESEIGDQAADVVSVYVMESGTSLAPDYARESIVPGAIAFLDRVLNEFVNQPDEAYLPGVSVILGHGITDDPPAPGEYLELSYSEATGELMILDTRQSPALEHVVLDTDDIEPGSSGSSRYTVIVDPGYLSLNDKILWVWVDLDFIQDWQDYDSDLIIDYNSESDKEASETMEKAYAARQSILGTEDVETYLGLSRGLWQLYQAHIDATSAFDEIGSDYDLDNPSGYAGFQHDTELQAFLEGWKGVAMVSADLLNAMSIIATATTGLATGFSTVDSGELEEALDFLAHVGWKMALNQMRVDAWAWINGNYPLHPEYWETPILTWLGDAQDPFATGEHAKVFLNDRYMNERWSDLFEQVPRGYVYKTPNATLRSGWNLLTIFAKGPTQNDKSLQFTIDLVKPDPVTNEDEEICRNLAMTESIRMPQFANDYEYSVVEMPFWIPEELVDPESPLKLRLLAFEREDSFDPFDDYFDDVVSGEYDYESAYKSQTLCLDVNGSQSFFVYSPVRLVLVDDEERILTDTLATIPGSSFSMWDIDGDGDMEQIYHLPFREDQEYKLFLEPLAGADPSDSFQVTWEGIEACSTLVSYTRITDFEFEDTLKFIPFGDIYPPEFVVSIMPNPVLPFAIDIYAYPTEELLSSPDVYLETSVESDTLIMQKLSGHLATVYAGEHVFTESAEATLSICGSDTLQNYGCIQRSFAAAMISRNSGAEISFNENLFWVKVAPGKADHDCILLATTEETNATELHLPWQNEELEIIETIRLSSNGEFDSEAIQVGIDLKKDEMRNLAANELALLDIESTPPELIPTSYDASTDMIWASINDMGAYALITSDGSLREPSPILPVTSCLYQNYPNPFNSSTTISFSIPSECHVRLDVVNVLGQHVTTLLDQMMPEGTHRVIWDGKDGGGHDCATGVYFYSIEAGNFSENRRMLLLK